MLIAALLSNYFMDIRGIFLVLDEDSEFKKRSRSEIADAQIPENGSDLTSTAGSVVVDDAVDLFHQVIGGSAVSNSNPGFIKILGVEEDGSGDEIIAYQSINTASNTITFATNGRNHNGSSGASTGKTITEVNFLAEFRKTRHF